MSYPYSGLALIEKLAVQHQNKCPGLFQQGTFLLNWRAKVGSFPHADVETLVSAGEPCGMWQTVTVNKRERNPNREYTIQSRPEDKRNVEENWQALDELPLHGYIPGASIRGVVRAWVNSFRQQSPELVNRMEELLGVQQGDKIRSGKIIFLDAFPENPTKLSLDIVNPQQKFQVYHDGQGTPLSLYTLGNGEERTPIRIAIRGIPGKATEEDVQEVWTWVEKALNTQGVGSRTASGYGAMKVPNRTVKFLEPAYVDGYVNKQIDFKLYSQGSAGPSTGSMELRPSHWRGWLRSWLLRFFLGVMRQDDAEKTVTELMGGIEPTTVKGLIRLKVLPGEVWGEESEDGNGPKFYIWQGSLLISMTDQYFNAILLPVMRIAVMLGGMGRGYRRPLHVFEMNNGRESSRGSYLELTHQVPQQEGEQYKTMLFGLPLKPENWHPVYKNWINKVKSLYPDRYTVDGSGINAEIFSPTTCAVYAVPGPQENPIDVSRNEWATKNRFDMRGAGMDLIYQTKYKRKPDVGGNAAAGNAYCSWVGIKRVVTKTETKEVVCLFLGRDNGLRLSFLSDLASIDDAVHLFGRRPQEQK
jgi:CRISPR-associated protein Cmr6